MLHRSAGSMALWAKPEQQSNKVFLGLGRVLSTGVLRDTGDIGAFMATGWDSPMEARCCEQQILLGCWGQTDGHQDTGGCWGRVWGRVWGRDRGGGVSSCAPWAGRWLGIAGLDL